MKRRMSNYSHCAGSNFAMFSCLVELKFEVDVLSGKHAQIILNLGLEVDCLYPYHSLDTCIGEPCAEKTFISMPQELHIDSATNNLNRIYVLDWYGNAILKPTPPYDLHFNGYLFGITRGVCCESAVGGWRLGRNSTHLYIVYHEQSDFEFSDNGDGTWACTVKPTLDGVFKYKINLNDTCIRGRHTYSYYKIKYYSTCKFIVTTAIGAISGGSGSLQIKAPPGKGHCSVLISE